ncbi:MAG TPA: amidohydrolase family protein [Candidatus Limnocylindrales bacterium]
MTATVVDAHHHFWDPGRADYPFLTDDLAAVRRAFGPADLAPLLESAGIDATVLVQARSSEDESRELLATAGATPFIRGVVGWVDLTGPDAGDAIARLRDAPGGDRLVGVRHQADDEPDPDWLARRDVRAGIARVGEAGLPFDLLVRQRELPAAVETVRAMPDVRFVVDHMAKPPIRDRTLGPWAEQMAAFRSLPNAWCKLSGLVTEADWREWQPADLRPYVDHALEVFGPGRLVFGSDWPVCLLATTYEGWLATARELLAGLSAAERSAIFGGNAVEVYRL